MEITREVLDKLIKVFFDKQKFRLGIDSYENSEYEIVLVDNINSHSIITKGAELINVKIHYDIVAEPFDEMFNHPHEFKRRKDFMRMTEQILRLIPRMFESLAKRPVADVLAYNPDKKKFRR